MRYLFRGHNSSGAANDNCIRVIVWAREAVRGAKVSVKLRVHICIFFSKGIQISNVP